MGCLKLDAEYNVASLEGVFRKKASMAVTKPGRLRGQGSQGTGNNRACWAGDKQGRSSVRRANESGRNDAG